MHYHLKATHGIEIELSPGLEERYLRMKTRATLNLLNKGSNSTLLPQSYGSNHHDDTFDTEDESRSDDSGEHDAGMNSEINFLEQKYSQSFCDGKTGNSSDAKLALDLSRSSRKAAAKSRTSTVGDVILYETGDGKDKALVVEKEKILVSSLKGPDSSSGENTSVYRCYLCYDIFASFSKLHTHLFSHLSKQATTYQCCFCEQRFHDKCKMQNHLQRDHSYEISGRKQRHTKDIYGDNSISDHFPCNFCDKVFSSRDTHQRHSRLHLSSRSCFCRVCGKNFNQYTTLQQHIKGAHSKIIKESKSVCPSWVRGKINFFTSLKRFKKPNQNGHHHNGDEPLNLSKEEEEESLATEDDITVVMPCSPPSVHNGESSNMPLSQHSSEKNLDEEAFSDNGHTDFDENSQEIRSAPKRNLLPVKQELSARSNSLTRSLPPHLAFQNQTAEEQDAPLNFTKTANSRNYDRDHQDTNNHSDSASNDSTGSRDRGQSPELKLPPSLTSPEAFGLPGFGLGMTSANHYLMAKALMAHQTLTQHLNSTSQPMLFPPNHLPPSLAAMTQMMSLPGNVLLGDPHQGTSKSPSPASHTSSKSEMSPEDRDRDSKDGLLGSSRAGGWGQDKMGAMWPLNMFSPDSSHTDGRKVTSLSRTHSRYFAVTGHYFIISSNFNGMYL